MQILITGGAGFIGSHLAERCLINGDSITVIDNLLTGTYENISALCDNFGTQIVFYREDILESKQLDKSAEAADVIIHLAAAVGVKNILENKVRSMIINTRGTEILLELASRYRKKIFIASSSEVYGVNDEIPFKESDRIIYRSPEKFRWSYAASKLVDEYMALAYHAELDLPVIVGRFFNVIGPHQTGEYGMVVPRFVQQALQNKPLRVFGDGNQTRTFICIDDALQAVLQLIGNNAAVGEIFNIGGEEEISILELAKLVIGLAGSRSEIELVPYSSAYNSRDFDDIPRRKPALDKIKQVTGFRPVFTLEKTIKKIIAAKTAGH